MKTSFKFLGFSLLIAGILFHSCSESESSISVTGVSLDKQTLTLAVDEDYTLKATVLPNDATDPTVTWTSSSTAIATVVNGKVTAVSQGTATITAKAGAQTATCVVTVLNSYDEGVVINGVKWATCNIDVPGAFAAKPEDPGMFYQWNRKTAWAATGAVTGWDSSVPTGTTWEKANDPSPSGWRVPTVDEIDTLLDADKVSHEWTTTNGINGRKFTDKATGNSLFLPAAGCRLHNDGTLHISGSVGSYWIDTAQVINVSEIESHCNYFGLSDWSWDDDDYRSYSLSVRAVAK